MSDLQQPLLTTEYGSSYHTYMEAGLELTVHCVYYQMFADSCRVNEPTYPFYYVYRELYTLRHKGCCHIIEKSVCLI